MNKLLPILLALLLLLTGCTAPAIDPDQQSALVDVLTLIDERMMPGTAGSSLTAAYLAATAMDWSRDTELGEDAIRTVTAEYMAGTDDSFPQKLQSVYNACDLLMTEDGAAILSDCGYNGGGYPWSESDLEALHIMMEAK